MPSLWGICQHKCYIKQAKKKKRRVGRYVKDCNIILFSCVERPPLTMRGCRSFALKIVPKNFVFDFLNEVAVSENGFEWSVEVLFHNLKGYDGMFVLEELFDSIVWSRIKSVWEPNSYL